MARVQMKAYVSPTLVLLAFDWADGADHDDFLLVPRTKAAIMHDTFLVRQIA
jgi:hypothetical protein